MKKRKKERMGGGEQSREGLEEVYMSKQEEKERE